MGVTLFQKVGVPIFSFVWKFWEGARSSAEWRDNRGAGGAEGDGVRGGGFPLPAGG